MKKFQLGEFEEIVILAIAVHNGSAYSVSVKDEIESRLSRTVSLGALHTALKRMEEKGYLRSYSGDSNDDRAGRPKRIFEITALGRKAMHYAKDTRDDFWKAIPKAVTQINVFEKGR